MGTRSRYYEKMEPLYRREGIMSVGKIGPADCRLIDSDGMTEYTVNLIERYRDVFTHNDIPHGA